MIVIDMSGVDLDPAAALGAADERSLLDDV
jgi:hypothetical protein